MFTGAARFIRILLVAAIAVLFTAFAVVNRDMVGINLFPLPYTVDMPKFLLVVACFALGLLTGWLAGGLTQSRHKRELKAEKKQVAALKNEVSALHTEQHSAVPAAFFKS